MKKLSVQLKELDKQTHWFQKKASMQDGFW